MLLILNVAMPYVVFQHEFHVVSCCTLCVFVQRVKHSRLADQVLEASSNKMYVTGVDLNQLDICYPPIIQSGGRYALGKYCIVRSAVFHVLISAFV